MNTTDTSFTSHPLTNVKMLSLSNKNRATWLSFLLIPLSGLVTDIYIPSMPHMALELNCPEHSIQLTLTLFLVSYGISQFITGSLIDSYGRFRLTLFALGVFIVSNLVIVATDQIIIIYIMRIVQGIATGFIVVAKRAFFVDVYEGEERKHYLSIMSIVWSSAPVIAPFIGGYLEKYFNWQANFYALAAYALVMLLLEWIYSGETLQRRRQFNGMQIIKDYMLMLKDKNFGWGIAICGLAYGATMIFSLSGSFIIEHHLHFSAVVAGYAALLMGLAWMTGGFIGKGLIGKAFFPKLKVGNALQLLFAIAMIALATWQYSINTLLGFAFLVHICVGFIFNNYFAFCLGRFPSMAGMASGLTGGGVYIVTSVASYSVVGLMQPQNQQELGYGYLVMALISFAILHFCLKQTQHSVCKK